MSLLATTKKFSIATGIYRPVRWLSRAVRPYHRRAFEADVQLYRSLFSPGSLCFDVGANIGEKSEALLRAGARVVSFEPNPLVLPELRARRNHHKNWTIVEAALGSGAAIATLYARRSHGQSSLGENWAGNVIANYQVPVVTLDAAIEYFGFPTYCKLDVEGWELEVLRGLKHSIPLVSFEFHLSGSDIGKTISCLERLAEFGSGSVNVTPAETATFQFKEWMALRDFIEWFPGDLKQSLPGDPYGDIFVRRDTG